MNLRLKITIVALAVFGTLASMAGARAESKDSTIKCSQFKNRKGDFASIDLANGVAKYSAAEESSTQTLKNRTPLTGSAKSVRLFMGPQQDHGGFVWMEFDTVTRTATVYFTWESTDDYRIRSRSFDPYVDTAICE